MAKVHARPQRSVGETRDAGFQIGVRRTLPVPAEALWQCVMSVEGRRIWLGAGPDFVLEPDATYTLADGAHGEVRVVKPGSHVRLSWQPDDWPRASTIQVRVLPGGAQSVLAFHQEHLPDAAAREQRRAYFVAAMDALQALIEDQQT